MTRPPQHILCVRAPLAETQLPTVRPQSAGWAAGRYPSPSQGSSARLLGRRRGQGALGRHRKPHHKRAPRIAFIAPTLTLSAVRANNPVANAQAQTGPLAHLLRGIERVKDPLRIGNPRPIVADRYFDHVRAPPRMNLDAPALPRFLHRIIGII